MFLPRVNALAWDVDKSVLFIGGSFHAVDNVTISSSLAMWSKHSGLINFPGGGVSNAEGGANAGNISAGEGGGEGNSVFPPPSNSQIKALAFESRSQVVLHKNILLQNNP